MGDDPTGPEGPPRDGLPGEPPGMLISDMIALKKAGIDPSTVHLGSTDPDRLWRQNLLLQQLAGRISDDTLRMARGWIARDRNVWAFNLVAHEMWKHQIPCTFREQLELGRYMSMAAFEQFFHNLLVVDDDEFMPVLPWIFQPFHPDPTQETGPGADDTPDLYGFGNGFGADLTAPEYQERLDPMDRALVHAASAIPHVAAVVRSWRTWQPCVPTVDERDRQPLRVYLVNLDLEPTRENIEALNTLPSVYWQIRTGMDAYLDEHTPDAELGNHAFEIGLDLPGLTYQDLAWIFGAMLWTPTRPRAIRLTMSAEPGDRTVDHPDDRELLLTYLRSGRVVFRHTAATLPIPGNHLTAVHTDGTWVWPSTVIDNLETHHLAPMPPFLDHLVRTIDRRPTAPRVNGATAHHAMRTYTAWYLTHHPELHTHRYNPCRQEHQANRGR